MAYTILNKTTTPNNRIEYQVQLDSTRSINVYYDSEVSQEVIDNLCVEKLNNEKIEAENQAKRDKAAREALWTDEEKANLG